ncbi:MAG: galactose mutarotase [Planctomycetota bacterium]|jgi:aldose 1-epimerase|nr:galactose mutarotase [Planctomycetota bacterium]
MAIEQRDFGKLADGREVSLFILRGADGLCVSVSDYGGIVQSISAPDRKGEPGEIALGFPSLPEYLARPNYYGALIGRVANRIGAGRFSLEGKEYQLGKNNNGQHLHGGEFGFNRRLWTARLEEGRLRLDYLSVDGEEGYPGNLRSTVWYSLDGWDLAINYQAATDQTTLVNLTNHTFFNLNACQGDILRQELRLQADHYTPVDSNLIPTGEILPVQDTPMDFTRSKAIGQDFAKLPGGYDHNFVFSRAVKGDKRSWPVEVYDPDSGRTLAMTTSEPCCQFYSGNFLDGSDQGHGGKVYNLRYAFCLEAQKHPDAINHPDFASVVLKPGEVYHQATTYRFGVR